MSDKRNNKSSFVKRTPHIDTLRRPPRLKGKVQNKGIKKKMKPRGNR